MNWPAGEMGGENRERGGTGVRWGRIISGWNMTNDRPGRMGERDRISGGQGWTSSGWSRTIRRDRTTSGQGRTIGRWGDRRMV